jgi:hypothetical protein
MPRKIGGRASGGLLQRRVGSAGTLVGLNVNMADWSESELTELGPMLRGYIEASLPRRRDAHRAGCATCGEWFGNHPGLRSRFCPACRPQERLRAAREGMRRLRRRRKATFAID